MLRFFLLGLVLLACRSSLPEEPLTVTRWGARYRPVTVTVEPDTLALDYLDQGLMTATVRNGSGAVLIGATVTWTVRDTAKVKPITTNGLTAAAVAKAVGTTWVMVKGKNTTADSVKVVVLTGAPAPIPPTPPESVFVVLNHDTVTVDSGGVGTVVATTYRDAAHASLTIGRTVASSSTNPTVMTVTPISGGSPVTFTAHGLTSGTARLVAFASAPGARDTTVVIVRADTTTPPDTTSLPPTTCSGVLVATGASIQSAVNANPTGTVFCLSAGTYARQTVTPKASQQFLCKDALYSCMLDGQNATNYAFLGPAANVTIKYLTVKNYTTPTSNGAIWGYNSTGWRVERNEITGNKPGAGTDVWTGWVIRKNYIHHNGQLGITGQADGVGAVVDSNEIAYNNTGASPTDPNCCAGGMKTVRQTSLVVRGNFVHHNAGPGIWCDYCNTGNIIRGNQVEDNTFPGIFYEVSHAGLIDSNAVRRDGASNRGGIWVDNSDHVEVAFNTVIGPTPQGSILMRMVSHSVPASDRNLHDVYIHDNTVTLGTSEYVGCVQFVSDASYCSGSKNNRYNFNHYTQPSSGSANFRWNLNSSITRTAWQAAGQDASGTFAP